jgi:hypothetical protein
MPEYVTAGIVAFYAVWIIRRYYPEVWARLEEIGPPHMTRAMQALPGVAASAMLTAMASGGDPWMAVKGALTGVALPFVHHAMKSYTGRTGPPPPPPAPPAPPGPRGPRLIHVSRDLQ